MKLSSLFAKYLYLRKELSLPGIGIFTLDPSVHIPDPTEKNQTDFIQHIRYIQKPVAAADEEFINFIRTETGKIKPLAESDLDSFLTDGTILLNIGKPFYLEGIGSIIKTKSGVYEFTPGEPIHNREGLHKETNEDNSRKKPSFSNDYAKSGAMRILLIALAVIAGLALIIWGGYTLYNRTGNDSAQIISSDSASGSTPTKATRLLDSVKRLIDSTGKAAASHGSYKFIIERTANKSRAYRRYNQIREMLTDIKMESRDSVLYSLYFILPATPADTTRIKDSLKIWYGRRNVYVEK